MGAPAFRFYNYLKWARCRRSERLSETMPIVSASSIIGSANLQCSRGRTPDVDTTQWFPRMSTGLKTTEEVVLFRLLRARDTFPDKMEDGIHKMLSKLFEDMSITQLPYS